MKSQYTTDGTHLRFTVGFPYIERSHVTVLVNGTPWPFTWVSDAEVELRGPLMAGLAVLIQRVTPDLESLAVIQDSSALTADDLNRMRRQLLYLIQERSGDLGAVASAVNAAAGDIKEFTDGVGLVESALEQIRDGLLTLDYLRENVTRVGNTADALAGQLLTEINNRASALLAMETEVNQLTANVRSFGAQVTNAIKLASDGDYSLSERLAAATLEYRGADAALNAQIAAVIEAYKDGESVLTDRLNETIQWATANVEDLGARITSVQTTYQSADAAMAQRVEALTARTTANEAAIRRVEVVESGGSSAFAAEVEALVTRMGTAEAAILNTQASYSAADVAITEQINSLKARTSAAEASLTSVSTAQVNGDTALAARIDTLTTRTAANEAQLSSVSTAQTTADAALATRIDNLTARTATSEANITSVTKAYADGDKALSAKIDALTTRVGSAESTITSVSSSYATADTALSTRLDSLTSRVGTAEANITSGAQARVTGDTALSNRIDSLTARVGTAESTITSNASAQATANEALGKRIDTLTTRVGTNETSISSLSAAQTTADAALGVRIDNITSRVSDAEANITSTRTAYAAADIALGQRIDAVTARTTAAEASLSSIGTAYAEGDKALADQIDRIKAESSTTVLNPDPYIESLDHWTRTQSQTSHSVTGVSLTTPPAGALSSNAIHCAAQDITLYSMSFIPITALTKYRLEARARCNPLVASAGFSAAVAFYNASGALISSTSWLYAANDVALTEEAQTFSLDFGYQTSATPPSAAVTMTVAIRFNRVTTKPFTAGGWMEAWDVKLSDITKSQDVAAQVEDVKTAYAAADSSLASRIDALTTRVGTNETSITSTQTAYANADSALGTRIDSLTTRVGTSETKIGTIEKAYADADTAIGVRIDSLSARVGTNESRITTVEGAYTTADAALASRITSLESGNANLQSLINQEATTRANADSANATAITTVQTALNTQGTQLAQVQVQANTTATNVTGLQTQANTTATNVTGLQTRATSLEAQTSALVTNVTGLQTQASTTATNVAGLQTRTASLEAQYTIKVAATRSDGKQVIAGIGLAASSSGQSEIVLAADKLYAVPSSTDYSGALTPFFAAGIVNGAATLVIPNALIGDATIEGRMVLKGGLTVDHLNVGLGGGNVLTNSGPSPGSVAGWAATSTHPSGTVDTVVNGTSGFYPTGGASVYAGLTGTTSAGYYLTLTNDNYGAGYSCVPGKRYEAFCSLANYRCDVAVGVVFLKADGTVAAEVMGATAGSSAASSSLASWKLVSVFAEAPANAVSMRFIVRATTRSSTSNPKLYVCRAYLGEATAYQTSPSAWSPAGSSTYIDGRTISTGTVTADKLTVSYLSSLTANIGEVTAGLLRNATATTFFDLDATGTESVLKVGDAIDIKADGTASFGGRLTAADVVSTDNIEANAVTLAVTSEGGDGNTVTVPAIAGRPILLIVSIDPGINSESAGYRSWELQVNGVAFKSFSTPKAMDNNGLWRTIFDTRAVLYTPASSGNAVVTVKNRSSATFPNNTLVAIHVKR